VADLAQNEFQVFESPKHGDKIERKILSMRIIDPHKDASPAGAMDSGFRISTGAVCGLNATTHYQLAVQAAQESGNHNIQVKTTRPNITLSFRRHYYVGLNADEPRAKGKKGSNDSVALSEAACWHSPIPPTIELAAHPVVMSDGKSTRYVLVVKPNSLPDIGLNGTNAHIQLDIGICTYDSTGTTSQYLHSAIERQLNPEEMDRAQERGLPNVLEIPGPTPELARLVVRDNVSGNVGVVDVARPQSTAEQPAKALQRAIGSARSFGVVTPHENWFCGDVYDLSSGTSELPDFWNIDPVGSIFTDRLEVWDQDIDQAQGIPGATHSVLFFGVDYYGEFYVTKPGEYAFELQSDDGAKLEIDNQQLLDIDGLHPVQAKTTHVNLAVGRHTIHIPYFQGTPTRLALVLQVKPPDGPMRVFSLTDFQAPK
jgi:hypothetical protein